MNQKSETGAILKPRLQRYPEDLKEFCRGAWLGASSMRRRSQGHASPMIDGPNHIDVSYINFMFNSFSILNKLVTFPPKPAQRQRERLNNVKILVLTRCIDVIPKSPSKL
ncbi:MAG: hypothetical protein ACRERU_08535 [Methylococcales bacterium]